MHRYPPPHFSAPEGNLVLLVRTRLPRLLVTLGVSGWFDTPHHRWDIQAV